MLLVVFFSVDEGGESIFAVNCFVWFVVDVVIRLPASNFAKSVVVPEDDAPDIPCDKLFQNVLPFESRAEGV